jgi:phosphoserine phosphatase
VAEPHRDQREPREPPEHDRDAACQIQQAFRPRESPALEGYDIAGWYHPADETGGDFFDFQELASGVLGIALGDVSGHGFGPALVAASCGALLRATLTETHDPAEVLTRLNQLLAQVELEDRFVTAFFGVLEREMFRMKYVSAGQGPILFYSRATGQIDELPIQGFPLGLGTDSWFGPAVTIVLAPGDFLAVVTDGFFEWYNTQGECFGIDRTKDHLVRDRDEPAAEVIRRLHASVLDFVGGTPQPDDLTAVVIKRLR